jgi:hypothetical protein
VEINTPVNPTGATPARKGPFGFPQDSFILPWLGKGVFQIQYYSNQHPFCPAYGDQTQSNGYRSEKGVSSARAPLQGTQRLRKMGRWGGSTGGTAGAISGQGVHAAFGKSCDTNFFLIIIVTHIHCRKFRNYTYAKRRK